MRSKPWIVALLALAALPPVAAEENAGAARREYVRSHYAKYEFRIPMRDGVKLFTVVYVPNDASEQKLYPLLLFRTPYSVGPYGADRYRDAVGPSPEFEQEGFIFVGQDVRGRYMSEGEFVNMRPHVARKRGAEVDESSDTRDTIEWLLAHVPYHNGKVGAWGSSYPGFYASAGLIDSHPALVAVSPQAPIADWFWDDMHRHGAFNLALAFLFFAEFGVPREGPTVEHAKEFDARTPDGYQFFLDLGPLSNANARYFSGGIGFWNEIAAHPNYDAFWQARNVLPHLRNVRAAVLTVGGWFDTEDLYGPLRTYEALERQNPGIVNHLVMGPWPHGGWIRDPGAQLGSADFGFATAAWYREHVLLPFFRQHLKGQGTADLPEALVFETGANRWRRFAAWPPGEAATERLYLTERWGLAWEPPSADGDAADAWVSDPAKPVPYTAEITGGWSASYMTEDQRFASRRPDVLTYRGAPLEQDLTFAGPLEAELWVSTTGADADFVVKLIDEFPGTDPGLPEAERKSFPGGRQMLVRGEPFRGRFRESYETPKPFTPGTPARVAFRMNDVMHTFQRGHRVVVQIQSSWFPFIDRNPQSWVANIFEARESDFVPATHRIYRSRERPSHLGVRVLAPP